MTRDSSRREPIDGIEKWIGRFPRELFKAGCRMDVHSGRQFFILHQCSRTILASRFQLTGPQRVFTLVLCALIKRGATNAVIEDLAAGAIAVFWAFYAQTAI